MEYPVAVALAQPVPVLPAGAGWWYEPKMDGHRCVLWRDADTVRPHARSGRTVTSAWFDIALAGMSLPAGTVLDGEAVIWNEGRLDFSAVQARAASTVTRARVLGAQLPASYAVWDLLAHPDLGDIRARPYLERRRLLLQVLEHIGPPIQAVPATDDIEVARAWYEHLQAQGVEGVVAKRATAPYRAGRIWVKIRHADTIDAEVVGYTGPSSRPRALAVRLPDGRRALTQRLTAPLAGAAAARLAAAGSGGRARTDGGDTYTSATTDLTVEVLAGTTRHAVVTVTRVP
ncbi:ATP-dependent DNA ligase [Streptomyces violascens]|uniref:DNA ligase n=1 Tax=Streptomyces violascens TaxID=67381 RepID=A0ABQ3QL56_9ACTN|nr:DNA ligase [Streptomyces violascens]GGU44492.1 DNA ligase [Streptomyces violascens]GHI38005.1 DNA ligase [Streptomyces violascens]